MVRVRVSVRVRVRVRVGASHLLRVHAVSGLQCTRVKVRVRGLEG